MEAPNGHYVCVVSTLKTDSLIYISKQKYTTMTPDEIWWGLVHYSSANELISRGQQVIMCNRTRSIHTNTHLWLVHVSGSFRNSCSAMLIPIFQLKEHFQNFWSYTYYILVLIRTLSLYKSRMLPLSKRVAPCS